MVRQIFHLRNSSGNTLFLLERGSIQQVCTKAMIRIVGIVGIAGIVGIVGIHITH